MAQFKLKEWEWPQGWEQQYLIEPFETDFLKEVGIDRATICAILYKDKDNDYDYDMGLMFYRPDVPGADNYVFCRQRIYDWPSWAGKVFLCPDWLDLDESWEGIEAHRCQKGFHWVGARLFHLGKSFCLIRGTVGYWADSLENIREHSTLFNLPFDSEGFSSGELWQWLQTQFADPTSELHRTYLWDLQTWNENWASFATLPWVHEQKRMMELVARRESYLSGIYSWGLSAPPLHMNGFSSHSNSPQSTANLEIRLQLWSQILERHFPWSQFDEKTTPECIIRDYGTYAYSISIEVGSASISEHERVEATQYLREWAQNNVAPEEMKVLFPEDWA